MALGQELNYNDPNNFATDLNKVEFAGGLAQLKNLLPTSTFGANYNIDINGSWGDGVLTGTSYYGASVNGGKLDLTGGTKQFVTYDATGNADTAQTGCIRFLFTPNYITATGESVVFVITEKYNSIKNLIFYRDTGSHHRLHIFDQNGNLIVECYFGYKQWVQGQDYEIEFNFDITSGDIRMFIDGVQQGSTASGTGIRDSATIGLLQLGCSYQESTNANFKIDNFIVFDTVQHTADYIPGDNVLYTEGGVPIMVNSAIECDDIDELADLVHTASGSDNVRFSFDVDGQAKYYNSGWIISDGTYSQSNNYADLTPAVLAELLSVASRVKLIVYLYSFDGSTTPTITSVILYYDFGVVDVPTVNKCIIFGYISQSDEDKEGLKVLAQLNADTIYNVDGDVLLTSDVKNAVTNEKGYFDIELIENENMAGTAYYDFWLDGRNYKKIVPNEVSKNFFDLVDFES